MGFLSSERRWYAKERVWQGIRTRAFSSHFLTRWATTRISKTARRHPSISRPMTANLSTTRIYVDADACPVKDEIYRVAIRHRVPVCVVAGQFIRVPSDPLIERIAAGSAMDAA